MGPLLALLSGAAFGYSTVISRRALDEVGLLATMYWNLWINTCVFGSVWLLRAAWGLTWMPSATAIGLFACGGLSVLAAGRTTLYFSVSRIGASRASAFRVTSPVYTAFFGMLLLGERLTFLQVAGLVMLIGGLLGVTLRGRGSVRSRPSHPENIRGVRPAASLLDQGAHPTAPDPAPTATDPAPTAPDPAPTAPDPALTARAATSTFAPRSPSPGAHHATGVAAGIAAAIFFSVGDLLRKAGITQHPDAFTASAVSVLVAFIVVAGVASVKGRRIPFRRLPQRARAPLVQGSLGTALALLLLNSALRTTPVAVAVPLAATEALFALGFVRLLSPAAEPVTLRLLISTAVVVAGVALLVL